MCDNNIHQIKETADGEYSSSALGTQAEGFESEQADELRGFEALDLRGRVEAIRSLVSTGLIHVHEEIDREVVSLAESTGNVTGLGDLPDRPLLTQLSAPAPNLFNPRTQIIIDLARELRASLKVYDVAVRLVRTLVDGEVLPAGSYTRTRDGTDENGRVIASGVYRVLLSADGRTFTKAMALVR